jgi:uncharacterized membrane protein required for colicin V production
MIVDIIALVILVFCALNGMRQGFFRILFRTFSFITAIILVLIFYNPLYQFAMKLDFVHSIELSISRNVEDYVSEHIDDSLSNVNDAIDSMGFPEYIGNALKDSAAGLHGIYGQNTTELVSDIISNFTMQVAFGIVLFILLLLVINLVSWLTGLIAKLPVIHSANKLLGGAVGLLNGLIILYIAAFMIMVLPFGFFMQIQTYIDGTFFKTLIYDNNILFKLLGLIKTEPSMPGNIV